MINQPETNSSGQSTNGSTKSLDVNKQVSETPNNFAIPTSKWSRIQSTLTNIAKNTTVEPGLILFTCALGMIMIMFQSLAMRRFCLGELKYSEEICNNLTANKEAEDKTQALTTNLIMYKTILETLPGIALAYFVGSWSDKYGRKPLLFISAMSCCMSMVLLVLFTHFQNELNVYCILIPSIPISLTAPFPTFASAAFSYVADVTDFKTRTIRIALVQAAMLVGAPIGTACSGILFKTFNHIGVFITAAILYTLCAGYVLFILKESVSPKPDLTLKSFRTLFDLTNVKEAIKTLVKRRECNGRVHVFLLIVALAVTFLPLYTDMNLSFLYTKNKFKWDELKHSTYSTTIFIMAMLGLLVMLPLMSLKFKLKDATIGIISAVTKMCTELIVGLSTEGWMLYAASPALILSGMNGPMARTIMSKIVTIEEQGKIAAIMSSGEQTMPIIGSFLYNGVYHATLDTFPGAMYIMSSLIAGIPASIFIWLYFERRRLLRKSESTIVLAESGF